MTIKDLAKKTGYGVATVSRVLNNHPNVSEKARRIIMKAVEESGFELNDNAKQLKQQHATSVLVVVKGTSNEMFGFKNSGGIAGAPRVFSKRAGCQTDNAPYA